MAQYNPTAYATMHADLKVMAVDLKTDKGPNALHKELARADILLTSFRPSALEKLGLGWKTLHKAYPSLAMVAIVGAPGAGAEEPGHDLTYLADAGLVTGLNLPATLFADMGGALLASEAVLKAVLVQKTSGRGTFHEVALSDAAAWLALPRRWGLTLPAGAVGGAHAGYKVYPCKDGRVALAALEPHFAAALCTAAGVPMDDMRTLFAPATHQAVAAFLLTQSRRQLDRLAKAKDIPLHTLI
jgi:crotonobetainyl-CoA:carnitine CoA-transferase CaiB-like acyl-CoA transferase